MLGGDVVVQPVREGVAEVDESPAARANKRQYAGGGGESVRVFGERVAVQVAGLACGRRSDLGTQPRKEMDVIAVTVGECYCASHRQRSDLWRGTERSMISTARERAGRSVEEGQSNRQWRCPWREPLKRMEDQTSPLSSVVHRGPSRWSATEAVVEALPGIFLVTASL